MNKKRKIYYLLLLFFSTFLISSCGQSTSTNFQFTSSITPIDSSKPSNTSDYISLSSPSSAHSVSASTTAQSGNIDFVYQNSKIEFEIPIQRPSVSQSEESSITFASAQKDIEYKYKVLTNGLKEDIVLNQAPKNNQFQSRFKITNSDIYLNYDNILVFYDSSTQKYLYHFQKPFAIDSRGARTDNVSYQLYQNNQPLTPSSAPTNQVSINFSNKLSKLGSGNEFTLLITVDSSWLSDPSRVYPLTIDPTIITDPYDSTTYINTGASSNYQIVDSQLKINLTGSSCWGFGGYCDQECSFSEIFSGDIHYEQCSTYISGSSCTGCSYGLGYLDANNDPGCNSNGTGNCYMIGTVINCFRSILDGSCTRVYNVYTTGTSCTFYPDYYTSAFVQSTNLLAGSNSVANIDSFQYNLSFLPGGTSAGIKFSQNASTWYSSTGSIGASNTLTAGSSNSIDLSALNWSGSNFYYRLNFLSTGTSTPVLNSVSVTYSPPPGMRFEGVKMEGVKVNALDLPPTPTPIPPTPTPTPPQCIPNGWQCDLEIPCCGGYCEQGNCPWPT